MTVTDPSPIHQTMAAWLTHLAGGGSATLEDLLHPDVVFWSPVIFSPQQGRDLTLMYLTAASQVFPVNGVDIITCDDDGLITEFKVMIRPFKAVEAVRDRMAAMLA